MTHFLVKNEKMKKISPKIPTKKKQKNKKHTHTHIHTMKAKLKRNQYPNITSMGHLHTS